jgi:asparagine synthetase B (glutamine-hydrolysing)
MNAFAGFISLNSEPVNLEKIDSMASAMVGYVPDQKYIWGNSGARFAQVIRYNTPESFYEQPQENYAHDIRLDNRQELAVRLDIKLTDKIPDSQLVLKAYEYWGKNCLEYLRGDFAFAIWDPKSQELFCARDPMGQRLIYYDFRPGRYFAFATVVSGLRPAKSVNQQKVRDFLNLISPKPEETFYQNIFRLKAGECLTLQQGQIKRKTYYVHGQLPIIRFKKDTDYLEAFLEIFGQAVKSRLRSGFPIGAHLSGGLDSSSVVALAARELPKLITFSAFPPIGYQGFTRPNWNLDDTHYVEMLVAQYSNLESVYIRCESHDLFSGLDESYAYLDAPILNPCNRVWMHEIFEQAAQKSIRVLLTGAMGNATISWKGVTLKQRLGHILRGPRRLLYPSRWDIPNPRLFMLQTGMIPETSAFYQAQRAYFGVELRDPTHDQALVEFCLGLPNSQFARGNSNRILIRRAMKGWLPDALRMRLDQGNQLADWPSKIAMSYERIQQEWCLLRTNQTVRQLLDVEQVDNWVASWPEANLESFQATEQYRLGWLRNFFVARFINWMEYGRRG